MTSPDFSDAQQLETFVPVYDAVPEKWDDARPFIVEQLKRIANAVNIREIGWFLDEELLSGKSFIPSAGTANEAGTSQTFRTILRKVIDFGTLPNAGTKSVPHGITFDNNFTLIQLYAAATAPSAFFAIPIPYAYPVLNQEIGIYMDSVNINIITGVDQTDYTRCFVIIEYLQEL